MIVLACQRESDTDFDDSRLPDGASAASSGGSQATAGQSTGAQPATGGLSGVGDGGSAAGAGESDTGGSAAAGTEGKAGSAPGTGGVSEGGSAGSAAGGTGGKPTGPDPSPVTLTITDIADAHVASCSPHQNFGSAKTLMVDGAIVCRYLTLIAPALEQIPADAQVTKASLELTCTNSGSAITVSYAEDAWSEGEVRWSSSPNVGATLSSFTCDQAGRLQIDLLSAVKAWLSGEHPAYGVYLQNLASMVGRGTSLVSAEGNDAARRPALVVTYVPSK